MKGVMTPVETYQNNMKAPRYYTMSNKATNNECKKYSFNECVAITGVSASTLRRKKKLIPDWENSCLRTGWKVTKSQLESAGFSISDTPHDTSQKPVDSSHDTPMSALNNELEHEIELLNLKLESAKTELEHTKKALALAESSLQREMKTTDELLALLNHGGQAQLIAPPSGQQAMTAIEQEPQKKGFWSRLFSI